MTLLSAITEAKTSIQHCFTSNVVQILFIFITGLCRTAGTIAVFIHVGNHAGRGTTRRGDLCFDQFDWPEYVLLSLLETICCLVAAKQGFKEHITTRVMLDEVLGLELSYFARLLNLRPGVIGDQVLMQQVAKDIWFIQVDYERNAHESMVRRNLTSPEGEIMALALRTRPHTNSWLCLSPRVCTLGEEALNMPHKW